jgi:hypothetical protein
MVIFIIFLLLFNISVDHSRAYFYTQDDKSDINDKQCFCEVSEKLSFLIRGNSDLYVKLSLYPKEHVHAKLFLAYVLQNEKIESV